MIYKIFAQALTMNPEGLAIVTHDGLTFSYQKTEEVVLKWVHFLLNSGIQPNDRVLVLTENEDLHIFIFLALNRMGVTYLPFDLDTPTNRIRQALEGLSCAKLIIDEHLSDVFHSELVIKINDQLLKEIDRIHPLSLLSCEPNISYILPSSGTTGLPKWIPVQGDGLLYWAEVEKKLLNLTTNDRILCTRSPAYDARISEYVRAFAGAGTLFLMSHSARKDMESILENCQKNAITCLILIASQLNQEKAYLFLHTLKQHGLKHLMVTGDACSPTLVKICEQLDISLWNCYGPTEATFGMSILKVNGLMVGNQVPIGYPIPPVQAHIIEGELYIESPFLSPGYLNYDEKANQEAFPTLLINDRQVRVFRPGDLFTPLPNNLLAFLGRAGDECHAKVNGVKISPFAIEQCIRSYSLTAFKAAVVIKPWQNQDKPFAYLQLNHEVDKNDCNFSISPGKSLFIRCQNQLV
jgi:non-ribosomal peptide synthetase component F